MTDSKRRTQDRLPDNRLGAERCHQEGGEFFLHFHTGLLLGLLAIVLTAALHERPWIAAMDRLGDNLAQRVYAEGEASLAPGRDAVVLLDLDFSHPSGPDVSEVDDITKAIKRLGPMRPKAILIDQEILGTSDKKIAEEFIAAVRETPTRIVLVPPQVTVDDEQHEKAGYGPINGLRGEHNVQFASPLLLRDADGLVRSVPTSVCLTWPDGSVQTVPSLAFSATKDARDGCDPAHVKLDIIYSVTKDAMGGGTPAVRRITTDQDLDHAAPAVAGKVVIVGETGQAAWRDDHSTPIGMLPGPLIHANALLMPEGRTVPLHASQENEALSAGLGALAAVGCFAANYLWHRRSRVFRRPGWSGRGRTACALVTASLLAALAAGVVGLIVHHDTASAARLLMEVVSVAVGAGVFASYAAIMARLPAGWPPVVTDTVRFVAFLTAAAGFILLLATFWIAAGAWMLPMGWHTASLVPALAAGLEALLKAGGRLIHTLESAVGWLMRSATVGAALLLPVADLARAAEPPAAASAQPAPAPRSNPWVRSFQAFVHLVWENSPPPGPASGAGVRTRGSGSTMPPGWLPALSVDGAKLPAGSQGVALAWQEGAPPFRVTLESESGAALGSFKASNRFLWLPAFKMPAEPVFVSVSDAEQGQLSATLVPADRPAPAITPSNGAAGAPAGAAMALFVDGGTAWRLEALRQLAALAPASPEAADALAEVRRAADAGSPP